MAVDEAVRIGEIARVVGGKENGALVHQTACAARKVFLQVFLVVFALHDGIVDACARHVHPSDDVFVLLAQRIPVHRHIGERGFLFRQARCRGNVIVDLRAVPIAIANNAKHAERNRKHDCGNDKNDRPHAALSRTAMLAAAHVRTVIGTGVVGGVLRRRPRRASGVGGIGICGMTRLRRARRNEPTLLGGPLRRIRAIGILLVRIHAAHYRRKGAAAQRNSCPVRLFFTKAASQHSAQKACRMWHARPALRAIGEHRTFPCMQNSRSQSVRPGVFFPNVPPRAFACHIRDPF